MTMTIRTFPCLSWCALLLGLAALCGAAQAQTAALKTRNVVLIVSDGLRWQEIFTGADATLLNEKHGGIWKFGALRTCSGIRSTPIF